MNCILIWAYSLAEGANKAQPAVVDQRYQYILILLYNIFSAGVLHLRVTKRHFTVLFDVGEARLDSYQQACARPNDYWQCVDYCHC